MTHYIEFLFNIDGDDTYFSVPSKLFDEFQSLAKRRKKKMSELLAEGIRKHGYSVDIINKIVDEYSRK